MYPMYRFIYSRHYKVSYLLEDSLEDAIRLAESDTDEHFAIAVIDEKHNVLWHNDMLDTDEVKENIDHLNFK
jgi:hypothetical protein